MMTYTVNCDWCSEEFSPRQKDQRTCSNKCKLALRRAKIKDLRRAIGTCFNIPAEHVSRVIDNYASSKFFELLEIMGYEFVGQEWQNKKVSGYSREYDRRSEPHHQRKTLCVSGEVATARIEDAKSYGSQDGRGRAKVSLGEAEETMSLLQSRHLRRNHALGLLQGRERGPEAHRKSKAARIPRPEVEMDLGD